MTPDELRDHCLSFRGTEETFPFGPGNSVFKVAGKIFALSRLTADPLRVSRHYQLADRDVIELHAAGA